MENLNKKTTKRIIKSKCLADAFVWLGFEYTVDGDAYVFERTRKFDLAFKDMHYLKSLYRE